MIKNRAAMIIAVLVLLLSAPVPVSAAAENSPHYENAIDLKLLGLLKGDGKSFGLERSASRLDGAIMLVRLLGKEKAANQAIAAHPFQDVPSWANSYLGYLYETKITAGMSADTYGSGLSLSGSQYVTLVLRALGYSESERDFTLDTSLEKAVQIGLLNATDATRFKNAPTLTMDSVVMISYNALKCKRKGLSTTLLDKLAVEDRVVSERTAELLGLYTSRLKAIYEKSAGFKPAVTTYGLPVKNSGELALAFQNTLAAIQPQLKIDIRSYSGDVQHDIEAALEKALVPVSNLSGVQDLLKGWSYTANSSTLTMTVNYRYARDSFVQEKQNYRTTLNKARYIVAKLDLSMGDFSKELTLHNTLVNNCSYDYTGYKSGNISNNSFKPYGSLVLGKAVCQGYSEAMKLLCDLAGLECITISGTANNSGRWEEHSWNLIRLEGNYYHLDPTFDDPIVTGGEDTISFCFFNLSDAEIKASHQWDKTAYPACTSTKYNYYSMKNLVVGSKDELKTSIQKAAASGQTSMEFKLSGFTAPSDSDLQKIISTASHASDYFYSINERFNVVKIFDLKY